MEVDDAELLALAGGDSSDDETPQQNSNKPKAVSPLPSIEVSKADSEKAPSGSTKPNRLKGGSNKLGRKGLKDDSEEEGEA